MKIALPEKTVLNYTLSCLGKKEKEKRTMETSPELIITREEWNGWHLLLLTGKFVVKSFNEVRKYFDDLEQMPELKVAVDLTHVSMIDSSALTIILNLQKRLKAKDGQVAIIGPNPDISETFSIVGFSLAVPIYGTRATFEKSVLLK
jgi:anti-anti-sigma factor